MKGLWSDLERAPLDQLLECAAIGSPETVRRALAAIQDRTQADEMMIATQVFDQAARLRSFELVSEIARAG